MNSSVNSTEHRITVVQGKDWRHGKCVIARERKHGEKVLAPMGDSGRSDSLPYGSASGRGNGNALSATEFPVMYLYPHY